MTIDVGKHCDTDASNEKFFYFSFTLPAISSKISELLVHVETYLLQVEMNLMEIKNEALLFEYKRSCVYSTLKEFQRDKALGDVPFSDGPLAFLVLFGLRRYLENKGDNTMALTFVEETGQWITDKFSDHHTVIDELFQHVADSTSVQKADTYKNKLAQEYLCIEKPVDFSALQSDTSASYF